MVFSNVIGEYIGYCVLNGNCDPGVLDALVRLYGQESLVWCVVLIISCVLLYKLFDGLIEIATTGMCVLSERKAEGEDEADGEDSP
jgi:hypothetical protein